MKDEKLAREQIADNGKNNKTKFPVYDDIPTKKKKKITSASQSLSTRQLISGPSIILNFFSTNQ